MIGAKSMNLRQYKQAQFIRRFLAALSILGAFLLQGNVLTLGASAHERELERSLLSHLKDFWSNLGLDSLLLSMAN